MNNEVRKNKERKIKDEQKNNDHGEWFFECSGNQRVERAPWKLQNCKLKAVT